MRICHIAICDLSGCTIFTHTNTHALHYFRKTKVIQPKTFVSKFFTILSEIFCHSNKTEIFSADFRKMLTNIKFSSKSVQWEPSCSVRTDRQTDTLLTMHGHRNLKKYTTVANHNYNATGLRASGLSSGVIGWATQNVTRRKSQLSP